MKFYSLKLVSGLLFTVLFLNNTDAATTKFNYQGQVTFEGSPANDTFDVWFKLFDNPDNISSTELSEIFQTLVIENGLLYTELDFGDVAFNGQDLWLEVLIEKPNGVPGYFRLTPRIAINTSPYAIQANFIADDGINSGSVEDGSLLGMDLANLTISNSKIANSSIGFEKFSPNGASEGDVIQYNSTSGEWESATLSSNATPWTETTNGILYDGNVGISTGNNFTPSAPLEIRSILNTPILKVNLDGTIERTLQTKFLTLGYQAFTPEKSSFQYEINSSGTTAGLSNTEPLNQAVSLYAPIIIPHGAIITKFELLAFDDDPTNQVTARIKRTSFTANNTSNTLSTISTGSLSTPGGIVISSGLLNENYFSTSIFYAFITIPKPGIPGTELIFSGVKITYQLDSL